MKETISEHLQDSLIYLCIVDDNVIKLVVNQVPDEFFSSEHINKTYKIICNYFAKNKCAPKDHLHDEIVFHKEAIDEDLLDAIVRYILYLKNQFKTPPDVNYVLSKLNDFIRSKTYMKSTYLFAELVEKGKFDEAQLLMQKTLRTGIHSQQVGSNFFEDDIVRTEKPETLFSLDIPEIDKYVRIKRSDLITIAGTYKGCKSWFGHHIGFQALRQGLVVAHVSHENSLDDVIIRYDMMIGGLVSDSENPREVEIVEILPNGKHVVNKKIRDTIFNKKLVLRNRKKFKKVTGGKLFIQKYPMGTCSVGKLDTFIEQLENLENVKVDVCITDYADKMLMDSNKQPRDAINECYIGLKGIADDRNICMVTMSQINDEGANSLMLRGRLEGRHLAEDKRKFGNIDKGFFIGTNADYQSFNEYIVGCFANRNGPAGRLAIIGMNLEIGQFIMYSYPLKKEV